MAIILNMVISLIHLYPGDSYTFLSHPPPFGCALDGPFHLTVMCCLDVPWSHQNQNPSPTLALLCAQHLGYKAQLIPLSFNFSSANHHVCWVYLQNVHQAAPAPSPPAAALIQSSISSCLRRSLRGSVPTSIPGGPFWNAGLIVNSAIGKPSLAGWPLLTGLAIGFAQQYWSFLELASCVTCLSHRLFYA